jgi:nickel-type superoxide dismutase maturation protease
MAAVAGAGVAAAWAWWLRLRPFRVAVEGTSMAPALQPGDFLIGARPQPGSLRRGTLVVVEHPSRPGYEMVKRLAGAPGDRVDGRHLLDGEYWVLGDAPSSSTDSRAFGPVGEGAIRGVVVARYWPPGRAGLMGRERGL